jgi:PspC domain
MNTSTVNPEVLIHEPEGRTEPHRTALRRPFQGRIVTGIAASMARYLSADVTIVRIVLAGFTIFRACGRFRQCCGCWTGWKLDPGR